MIATAAMTAAGTVVTTATAETTAATTATAAIAGGRRKVDAAVETALDAALFRSAFCRLPRSSDEQRRSFWCVGVEPADAPRIWRGRLYFAPNLSNIHNWKWQSRIRDGGFAGDW